MATRNENFKGNQSPIDKRPGAEFRKSSSPFDVEKIIDMIQQSNENDNKNTETLKQFINKVVNTTVENRRTSTTQKKPENEIQKFSGITTPITTDNSVTSLISAISVTGQSALDMLKLEIKAALNTSIASSYKLIDEIGDRLVDVIRQDIRMIGHQNDPVDFEKFIKEVNRTPVINIPTPLIDPLELDEVAQETTLNKAVDLLKKIADFGDRVVEVITDLGINVVGLSRNTPLIEELESLEEKNMGYMEKLFHRLLEYANSNIPYFQEISEKIGKYLKPTANIAETQLVYLRELTFNFRKWFEFDRLQRLRGTSQDNNVSSVRQLGLNIKEMLIPTGGQLDTALQVATAVGALFGTLGGSLGSALLKALGSFGLSGTSGIAGTVTKGLSFLLGSVSIMGSLVAIAVAAMGYSMWKNPELIGEYATAFLKLWDETVLPALKYLNDNVVIPFLGWWNSEGEGYFEEIGTVLNKSLIHLIGEVLPAIGNVIGSLVTGLTSIGENITGRIAAIFGADNQYVIDGVVANFIGMADSIISAIVGFGASVVSNFLRAFETSVIGSKILKFLGISVFQEKFDKLTEDIAAIFDQFIESFKGMFGEGKEGSKGFFGNILNMGKLFLGTIISVFDKLLTGAVNLLDLNSILGLKGDESVFEAAKRGFKERITSLVNALLAIIPTWDDIKKMVGDIIPDWAPGKEMILEKLNVKPEKKDVTPKTEGSSNEAYNKAAAASAVVGRQTIINAPTTVTNNSSSNVNNGGGARAKPGGVPSTRPQVSPWESSVYGNPGR